MQMVTMQDYAGFSGFGQNSQAHVDELNKALAAGYQSPRHDGGSALRVESLEATLRVLTFTQEHIRLWRDIPKVPAYSTSEEYNVLTRYGQDAGAFVREGEIGQVQDASYERRVALVKYVSTQREVTHVMTLVKPAHGNVIALETQNGAIWLMERMERALFYGDSAIVPESWDGIYKQIIDSQGGVNVVDCRGGVLTEERIEEAANIAIQGYGVPSDLYAAPRALSDMAKQFYPRERINLPAPANGRVGIAINEIMTQSGPVRLKNNMFLRSGRNNSERKALTSANSTNAPTAPTLAAALVSGPVTGSVFTAADVGTFRYAVSAINRFGESAASAEATVAIAAAGDAGDLTITDGGGTHTATGYSIYRSKVGGAALSAEFIKSVPRAPGAATTVVRDLNKDLPSTSKAFLLQVNMNSFSFRQLTPMIKIPLATLAASIRWAQLLYGTPIVYSPDKNVVFTNLYDD